MEFVCFEYFIGKNDFDLYPLKAAEKIREEDLKVMNTLEPIIGKETKKTTLDGKSTSFLSSKIPLLKTHNCITSNDF